MPLAPVNRTKNTQAPTENPCVSPQYGTSVTAAKKVNKNTRLGAQLKGARDVAGILCDIFCLEWSGSGRNVARPMRRCGTCVRITRLEAVQIALCNAVLAAYSASFK